MQAGSFDSRVVGAGKCDDGRANYMRQNGAVNGEMRSSVGGIAGRLYRSSVVVVVLCCGCC